MLTRIRTSPYSLLLILGLALMVIMAACHSNPAPNRPPTVTLSPGPAASTTPISAATLRVQTESGDTVIRLSWQAIPGSRGYFVFRDNGATPLNPSPIADNHFDDIGLTNGRTYTYTIAAVGQNGQMGPHSSPMQAVPKSQ